MKNLFAVLGLFFACTITALAQDTQKQDPRVLAKQELDILTKVIELDNAIANKLNNLLIYKHKEVAEFPEKKEELAKTMESKLENTLTVEQYTKVKKNKVVFNDLLY